MIDLHFWPTPNSLKVSIFFEEIKRLDADFQYRIVPCSIGTGDQFEPSFIAISPNNRMPAIVDHAPVDGGEPLSVFESAAIMLYVAEKTGFFLPQSARLRSEVNQWLFWQMANQGPKFGEAGHYRRLGERQGDQSYAMRRYGDEVNRLYGVMNNRLYDRPYLAGDAYGLADMVAYPWCSQIEAQGEDIRQFKYFKRWWDTLSERPAVQAGMAVGSEMRVDTSQLSKEEIQRMAAILFNQRARPAPES